MGPYARIHRDYKYTSEYALLEKYKREGVENQGLEKKSEQEN